MRLGAWECKLDKESNSFKAYGKEVISERHRHRYEFNNQYREVMQQNGFRFAGTSPDGKLVEIVEDTNHPWYVAVQFHPEFKSRLLEPHPLFSAFVAAAKEYNNKMGKKSKKKDTE